ncbi:MAG: RNA-binding cell elongation regulator Jag/EloR [Spirochaetales bacterium]
MKEYEFSSRNVQDAISKGLKELNRKQEDVDIKILNEGGLFSKAKILIITDEVEEVKPVVAEVKPEPKKEVKPEVKEEKPQQPKPVKKIEKQAEKQEKKEVKEEKKEEKKETKKQVVSDKNLDSRAAILFVKNLAKQLNADIEIKASYKDEDISIEMEGQNAGNLIGYRGEGLNAIQYLANVVENSTQEHGQNKRVVVNIEGYKEKREEALINLAKRLANKVIRTGKYQRLEPMNAYERLIIHTALADEPVKTYSKGEEPHRYLIIEPKK